MIHVVLQRRLPFVCAMVHVPNNFRKNSLPLLQPLRMVTHCIGKDNSRTVDVAGMKLDNRWVVPYNPYLLLNYNAHINVEICSTVCAVKYIYKYVYKGHDRAIIEFQSGDPTAKPRQVDEVSNYLEARYIYACEACYRIFSYDLHANLPHVMRLALHLENQQSVVFRDDADIEAVLKYNLINTFITSTQHHHNVMRKSGILSEQELHEHINAISAPNEWGTNVELNMLAALAGIEMLLVDSTDVNSTNWNILPNYLHNQLDTPIGCDPFFNVQKVCILHHRLSRLEGNEHFDSFFFA